jgi:hypothetical protein
MGRRWGGDGGDDGDDDGAACGDRRQAALHAHPAPQAHSGPHAHSEPQAHPALRAAPWQPQGGPRRAVVLHAQAFGPQAHAVFVDRVSLVMGVSGGAAPARGELPRWCG